MMDPEIASRIVQCLSLFACVDTFGSTRRRVSMYEIGQFENEEEVPSS